MKVGEYSVVNNFAIALKVRILTEYAVLWTEAMLNRARQVFVARPPCKGSALPRTPASPIAMGSTSVALRRHSLAPALIFALSVSFLAATRVPERSHHGCRCRARCRRPFPPQPAVPGQTATTTAFFIPRRPLSAPFPTSSAAASGRRQSCAFAHRWRARPTGCSPSRAEPSGPMSARGFPGAPPPLSRRRRVFLRRKAQAPMSSPVLIHVRGLA
jgi:hypothetical protein